MLILLDELGRGDISKGLEVQYSLLSVLDKTQNKEFQDLFLCEFNHDISKIWFIVTLNDEEKINSALKDRLNIIDVPSYTKKDMTEIVKRHTCLIIGRKRNFD